MSKLRPDITMLSTLRASASAYRGAKYTPVGRSRLSATPNRWSRDLTPRLRLLQGQNHLHTESFLQGNTAEYLDQIHDAWKQDPSSVDASWKLYFEAIENGHQPPDTCFSPRYDVNHARNSKQSSLLPGLGGSIRTASSPQTIQPPPASGQAKVERLVRAYRDFGHLKARTNPLDIPGKPASAVPELDPSLYGLTSTDMDRKFSLGAETLPHFAATNNATMTLRDIIQTCEAIYCDTIATEYTHLATLEERNWVRARIETPNANANPYNRNPPAKEKKQILNSLIRATGFEKFLAAKFPNAKRFGLEGAESQLPAVEAIIDTSAEHGVRNIIFPCCHRGKLNILSNVGQKPNELIFSEFAGAPSRHGIPGDVKYHLGMSCERVTPSSGEKVNISILPNPSHLEAQNPVAQGMARALQQGDGGGKGRTMVFNSHTDASFSGQGIVYETLGLSGLEAYRTGGTVHLIVNNQVGFTTDPASSRSSTYVSDVGKSIQAPVFHVNADDVESVVFVCKLAAEYRARFGKDCLVDLVCYRKNGHNEMDQPSFTQPLMYETIARKTSHLESYTAKLLDEGVVTREEVADTEATVWKGLSESLDNSKDPKPLDSEYTYPPWKSLKKPSEVSHDVFPPKPTAISPDVVSTIANKLGVPEEPFVVHKSLNRILQKRQQSLIEGRDIDWATAEALALGSLCVEGYHVRLSGQDVERGTFSQRHSTLHDQRTGKKFLPLNSLSPGQAEFAVANSSLSEYGVMGFDYGYSCMNPNALVMWEAQFGDFANNAQCIIDQFISSAENKWLLRSGLVLSLPHGLDGQGPEHSSARMERFLQLCNEDGRFFPSLEKLERKHQDANMQVVYMTSPANLFHVLRRQLHRDFRKPLILFFSKSLLRHPLVKSNVEDFIGESRFHPVIPDPHHKDPTFNSAGIKRVIYCTGQVYFALSKYRETHGITDTAITRVEQLHPFPWQEVRDNLQQYPNASDIVWCQEESLNDGPWAFSRTRLETIFDTTDQHRGRRLRFAGRPATSSVATGFASQHQAQEADLLREAFQTS